MSGPDASYDAVVVGGGIAGLVAAARLSELGKRVAVLEKGTEDRYLCNTRYTGGTLHVAYQDVQLGEDELYELIRAATAGTANEAVARALARDARRAVKWLQGQGIRFVRGVMAHHSYVLAPPGRTRTRLEWEGRGGDVLLRTLGANIETRGGKVLRGMRARTLTMADGRCTGVTAEGTDGATHDFRAEAVVLADGGFSGNPELVGAHISKRPETLLKRGAGTGLGDGLLMAKAVGAATTGLDNFYGHLLSRDARTNDDLWPYPYLDNLVTASIAVDAEGRRFADEGQSGVFMANAVARLDDPLSATVIFDQAIWDGPGRTALIPVNPNIPKHGGTLHSAPTLDALAALAGLPAETLKATVTAYNEALARGDTASLAPPRRADLFKAHPIVNPPFHAIPVLAGITYTMGGIVIDEHSRVLNEAGDVIAGLFAAGTSTGGTEGGPTSGYTGGLIKGAVTGMRAAETIAGVPHAA